MNREGTTLAPHAHLSRVQVPGSTGEIAKLLLPAQRKKLSLCPLRLRGEKPTALCNIGYSIPGTLALDEEIVSLPRGGTTLRLRLATLPGTTPKAWVRLTAFIAVKV